jgi:FtsP/CotA-like multicopper oxidase with cupredoxin domain
VQVPKKHLPVVGLLGLVVIAAAGGGIYYYAYVSPPGTSCGVASHRLFFMTAVIFELGGFQITNGAYLNQTTAPTFNATTGPSLAGVKHQNYTAPSDHKTINAIVGDTITLYIYGVNASDPRQFSGIPGHGFTISPSVNVQSGTMPGTIPLGKWYTVTFTVTQSGTYSYFCTIPCSNGHGQMTGNMVVSCG